MTMLASLNPLDGSVVGTVETTTPDAVPNLVARARGTQPKWAELGIHRRAELLGRSARRFVQEAEAMVVGDGLDELTSVGPMVNDGQRRHVLEQLSEAVERGGELLTGGMNHTPPFIKPTVLANVGEDLCISRDETFGPVICVTRVSSDDEAVRKAKATPFGLGAVVFGKNPERAEKVARQLSAGMVGINRGCGGIKGTPRVGAGESGYGFHKGRDGHRQFTQTRVVSASK